MKHRKKQENMASSQKKKLTVTVPEETQTLHLLDKDICLKYTQRVERNHEPGTKGNQENDVFTNKEYQ